MEGKSTSKVPLHIEQARKLKALVDEKERLKKMLSDLEKQIDVEDYNLRLIMKDIGSMFQDEETGIIYAVETKKNAAQSDYAKENNEEFAKVFSEKGHNIFSYTCNAATFGALVKNQLLTTDEFGNEDVPDWAKPYIKLSEYKKVKIK